MKLKLTFLLTFLILICSFTYVFADDIPIIKNDLFTTKITFKSGEILEKSGIIDADKLEKSEAASNISSYEILKGDTSLILVNLFDIKSESDAALFGENKMLNGYYSVTFTLSKKDNTEVFLTGLTPQNLEKVQNSFLESVIENSQFSLEDLDFIDTEKLAPWEDGDDLLCWAATASNMLHYTGWAQKANPAFKTTDDVFDIFVENFTDNVGNAYGAMEWFLNGVYTNQNRENVAQVKNYGQSGAYLKEYAASEITSKIEREDMANHFYKGYDKLHEGYGMYLVIGWMNEFAEVVDTSHAVTMWGYICDKDYSDRHPEYFKAFIVSDSDDNQITSTDRRNSPNTLHILNLSHYKNFGYNTWKTAGYGDCGIFLGYTAYAPYSDSILYETDAAATKNPIISPDLQPSEITLTQNGVTYSLNEFSKFYSGKNIILKANIANDAAVECPDGANLALKVINKKSGKTVYTKSYDITATIPLFNYFYLDFQHSLPTLENGSYSAVLTLNGGKAISEAYYYNNTKAWDFEIASSPSLPSKFTATVGKFEKGVAKVGFSFGNLSASSLPEGAEGFVYKSAYIDGEWSEYEIIATSGNPLPQSGYISADGTKVKFKYELYLGEGATPLSITSPQYAISYDKLDIYETEDNALWSVYLPYGETTIPYDKFAFKVKNISTANNGNIKYSVTVYAKAENMVLFKAENQTVAYGGESAQYEITSWSEPLPRGAHDIYAVLESDVTEKREIYLGTVIMEEKGSNIVTIEENIWNALDGETSLQEAVSYVQNSPEADEVIIPAGFKITLPGGISFYGSITINGNGSEISSSSGNVISVYGTTATFKNLTLNGNNVSGSFGISSTMSTVNLENVKIINMNGSAMGVSINALNQSKIYAKNCIFMDNTATSNHITYGKNSTLQFLNCVWENNSTYSDVIYHESGNIILAYCTLGRVNCLDNFNTPALFGNNKNGQSYIYGSIIAGEVSGYTSVYGSYIGSKSQLSYTTCDADTVVGEIDSILLTDENGLPVYKNGRYTLSESILKGLYIKNDNGKISYSYDNLNWNTSYTETPFSSDDFSYDMFGVNHGALMGADATASHVGGVVSKTDTSYTVFLPKAMSTSFIVSGYNKTGNSLVSYSAKEMSLSAGKNIIPLPERDENLNYKYMLWKSDLTPLHSPVEYPAE